MDELVVRRRARLMAVVAVSALLVAAGYLWRFLVAPSPLVLLVAVVLAVVGVGHLLAWWTSKSPVAAADDVGLRLRLGSSWCGLPWTEIERVEVDGPERIRDGHIAVAPRWPDAVAAGLPRSARRAAAINRLIYGAPLVAPFGISTTTSAHDVGTALEALAAGRTRIVRVDEELEPEPSVEITGTTTSGIEQERTASERSAGRSIARAVSALRSLSARDQTRPARTGEGQPATLGALALAADDDQDGERTVELPELPHLRRRTDLEPAELDPAEPDEVSFEPADDPADGPVWIESGGEADPAGTAAVAGREDRVVARVTWGLPGRPVDVPEDVPAAGEADQHPDLLLLIGQHIAEARQRLWLSVDEVAERTSIRPHVIEAIEADDFGPCGGDFYARGHLRTLARVLGIDAAPLLATYDAAFAAAPVDPRAVFDAELRTGSSGAGKKSAGRPGWALLLGAVLVLLLVWGVARYVAADSPSSPRGTTSTGGGNPAGLGSPGAGDQPVAPAGTVTITVRGVGSASRVVVTDGEQRVLFSGLLHPGRAKELAGHPPLTVTAANGGAVSLSAPGHRPGLLGRPGQRVVTHVRAR